MGPGSRLGEEPKLAVPARGRQKEVGGAGEEGASNPLGNSQAGSGGRGPTSLPCQRVLGVIELVLITTQLAGTRLSPMQGVGKSGSAREGFFSLP